jgi:hypothetical protein
MFYLTNEEQLKKQSETLRRYSTTTKRVSSMIGKEIERNDGTGQCGPVQRCLSESSL